MGVEERETEGVEEGTPPPLVLLEEGVGVPLALTPLPPPPPPPLPPLDDVGEAVKLNKLMQDACPTVVVFNPGAQGSQSLEEMLPPPGLNVFTGQGVQ